MELLPDTPLLPGEERVIGESLSCPLCLVVEMDVLQKVEITDLVDQYVQRLCVVELDSVECGWLN